MNRILFFIITAQFFSTSVWFASSAILPEIANNFSNPKNLISSIPTATQFGFILGTLVFAIFAIVDRFSPSRVFFFSAFLASIFNLTLIIQEQDFIFLIAGRFMVGFFLAGVYPVGMKIASDHFSDSLGKSLGYLVGALVLGTALPHCIKFVQNELSYQYLVYSTSLLALIGGFIILLFVPDGIHRKKLHVFEIQSFLASFESKKFRSAAWGYFGHMWELYTFWTFVPLFLESYFTLHKIHSSYTHLSLLSFLAISIGSLGCVFAGSISNRLGIKFTANLFLAISGFCCFLFPIFYFNANFVLFIGFLLFWGFAVVADSPMFSTSVAHSSSEDTRGSSLTIINCIGFAITILSIKFFSFSLEYYDLGYVVLILSIGPIIGLLYQFKNSQFKIIIKSR